MHSLDLRYLAFAIADEAAASDIEAMCTYAGKSPDGHDKPLYDPHAPTVAGPWEEKTIDRALRYLGARGRILWHGTLVQVHGSWSDA